MSADCFVWYISVVYFQISLELTAVKLVSNGIFLRSLHTESEIFACVFLFSSSFPIQMHATDAKTQKIETDPKFFMTDESFGGSV